MMKQVKGGNIFFNTVKLVFLNKRTMTKFKESKNYSLLLVY